MSLANVCSRIISLITEPDRRRDFLFYRLGLWVSPGVPEFPPMVMIDTTTRCNLKCAHCPNSELEKDKSFVGDMPLDLYRKIIDEIAEYPDTVVRPFDGGEPLMRKDLAELIAYAKGKGVKRVSINSNGTMLNAPRRKELVEAGLDHMEVSIDAATAETYLALRRSTRFYDVVENTIAFLKEMKEAGEGRSVTVSFVRQKGNEGELKDFLSFWQPKVDKVTIRNFHQHNALVESDERVVRKDSGRRYPCPYLFDRIIVYHDGRVRFCESDWMAKHAIGNANKQALKEIWNGEGYRRLRKSHIKGKFEHPFCASCTDWREVIWP